jgi:Response regulators consisting of a CheY-like receiver domain and a winged-helix DNA-binding domain
MKLELESPTSPNQFFAGDFPKLEELAENTNERVSEMLKAGIRAAQEGNRTEARTLLSRVTDHQPENETAWLWLASISEYPEELLGFLSNVLRINPKNERALKWAKATKSLMAKTLVQRGVTASREDKKEFARQCFEQALSYDDRNETALLWLASVADTPEEKIEHLEKVLAINPENETAQTSLQTIRHQQSQDLLKKANVAAISGDRERAGELLAQLMETAPEMEEAWILKAYLSQSYDEKLKCFEKVLELNPENETAQAGIESLNAIKQREMEAAAQRAKLENLQAVDQLDPETPENVSNETFAASEESIKADSEVPAANEENGDEQLFSTVENAEQNAAEIEIGGEEKFETIDEEKSEDVPTQELDQEYLRTVQESSAAFFTTEKPTETDAKVNPSEFESENAVSVESNSYADVCEKSPETPAVFDSAPSVDDSLSATTKEFALLPSYNRFESYAAFDEFASAETNAFVAEENVSETDEANPIKAAVFESSNAAPYAEVFSEDTGENNVENAAEEFKLEYSFERNGAPSTDNGAFANGDAFQSPEPVSTFETERQEIFETSSSDFAAAQENGVLQSEETDYELQADESVSLENNFPRENAEEISAESMQEKSYETPAAAVEEQTAPKSLSAQAEPAPCPFCSTWNEPQTFVCRRCRAVLTLSDLELMLASIGADKETLETWIRKMDIEKRQRQLDADELMRLGIAHLNLKNLRQGLDYLQEAVQMNPNNVVFSSQVHSLAIRLAEIEEQENKATETKSRTIMIVDDSPTVRKLISGKLEKCGHKVVAAVDGMDALAKINEVTPDLILLDITMPRLDGYQVCKLIRNNASTKDVPVIMISGRDGFFDKVRGRMAGSTGYITKPFGPDTLMKTIEAYIN